MVPEDPPTTCATTSLAVFSAFRLLTPVAMAAVVAALGEGLTSWSTAPRPTVAAAPRATAPTEASRRCYRRRDISPICPLLSNLQAREALPQRSRFGAERLVG